MIKVIYDPIDNLSDLTQPNTFFVVIVLLILIVIGVVLIKKGLKGLNQKSKESGKK